MIVLDLPVEAQPWARLQGLPCWRILSRPRALPRPRRTACQLISPTPNTTYHIAADFNQSAQQLSVEAAAGQGVSQVKIYVDGAALASFSGPPYQAWWTLAAGQHRFWAEGVDVNGETVKSEVVTITVLGNP